MNPSQDMPHDDRFTFRSRQMVIDGAIILIAYFLVFQTKTYLFAPSFYFSNHAYPFIMITLIGLMTTIYVVALLRDQPIRLATRGWPVIGWLPGLIILDKVILGAHVGIPIIFFAQIIILALFAIVHSAHLRWRVMLMVVTAGVALALLETLARVIFPQPVFDPRLPFYPYTDEIHNVDLDGVSPVIHRTTNKWGMRGDDPPEDEWDATYTIIAIGGSTTQCFYLDDAQTWPALLQSHLNASYNHVWVGNAGLDGHTTRGHLIVMEHVVREIKPDAVIFLVGANDFTLSVRGEQNQPFDEVRSPFDDVRKPRIFDSQLYRLAWTYERILIDHAVVVQQTGHGGLALTPVDPAELTPLPADLREILPSLPEYRQNLERLIDIAQEEGIDVLFLTQPTRIADTAYWDGIRSSDYWLNDQKISFSRATYARMLDLFNQELLAVCAERAVPCFDLATAVPPDATYFYDAIHFNEAGAALVAKKVTEAVETQLLPDVPPRPNP